MTIGCAEPELDELERLYSCLPAVLDFAAAASELHRRGFFDDIPAELMSDKSRAGYEAVLRGVVDQLVVHRHPRLGADGSVILDHLDPSPRIAATLGALRDGVSDSGLHTLVVHELVHIRLAEEYGVPRTIAVIERHQELIADRKAELAAHEAVREAGPRFDELHAAIEDLRQQRERHPAFRAALSDVRAHLQYVDWLEAHEDTAAIEGHRRAIRERWDRLRAEYPDVRDAEAAIDEHQRAVGELWSRLEAGHPRVREARQAIAEHEGIVEEQLESLRSVTNSRLHRAANERADFESLAPFVGSAWDVPDTAVPVVRRRSSVEPMYVESGAETDAQRRARLAKHEKRVKQELERLQERALKKAGPELQPHLKEALQRIDRSEGRTAQELRRQVELLIEKGPNQAGAGSVSRLINTANGLLRDRSNGIDLVQKFIAYGRELESTWNGFGGSYTDPKPARTPEIADDWFERAQRELKAQELARDRETSQFIREQTGVTPEQVAESRKDSHNGLSKQEIMAKILEAGRVPETEQVRVQEMGEQARRSPAKELGPRERDARGRGD
ncbi:hypothetical protein ACQHIV_31090 [Kribbella sp. GL6]|uniref:hypothetical protein n=1 Tax=Kribbella sp. GL6 TaxID=3419765 RepID=UPI003D04FD32